jgi:hypothetical protein
MMMTSVEQSVEWELTEETEVPGENLLQCHSVHHKSHMNWPGIGPEQAWVMALSWLNHYPIVTINVQNVLRGSDMKTSAQTTYIILNINRNIYEVFMSVIEKMLIGYA